ncbi:hypothetical protein BDB01DRAFT_457846 [Pilobolus umbonatus]|nr:hypothetical protein BDB01DRAFT_457846 [Pilobolus umbonatus]
MQPYGESGDSSDDTEESMSSREEEEKEYLRQIQTSSRQGKRRIQSSRASMRSQMSMMTPKSQQPSESNRPISVSSGRSGTMDGRRSELIRRRDLYEDNFDHTINPWILQPAHSIKHDDLSDNSYSTQNMSQNMSISSIVTERPRTDRLNALGPETRKALESLQAEIELLNERINGLRKEMEERDHSQRKSVKKYQEISNDWDGWKWVFTAAMKHALMNLMTATVLFLFLYKNDSPVAHVILDYWKKTKLQHWITRLLLSKKTI